jgi:peptidoglycan biosynthesis protein MviN/MurJ (putative lipid II flippase)
MFPETISILIAGGALATGFVPVFTDYLSRGEDERASHTFRAMLTLLGVAFGAISLLLFALTFTFAGTLISRLNRCSRNTSSVFSNLAHFAARAILFVLGGLFSGTLNALRLFWGAALQPVVFNLGIIFGGIVGPKLGLGIESQAWGALGGRVHRLHPHSDSGRAAQWIEFAAPCGIGAMRCATSTRFLAADCLRTGQRANHRAELAAFSDGAGRWPTDGAGQR